ncbi:MAG: hypothetical protein GXO77_16510 [Calditrichaeota bacterium]|nr:hypothetical protein [Calditrichota bacterium]
MKNPQLKEEISLENHRFLISTGLDDQQTFVISEVTEQGNFLYRKASALPSEYILNDEIFWNQAALKVHNQMKDEIEALFAIEERLKNVNQYQYHYRFGRILLSYHFIDEAKKHLKICIENKPDFVKARRKLAACHLKIRDYKSAKDILTEALNKGFEFPDLLNDLGVAHTLLSEYSQAKDILQRALEIKPNFPEANFNLGVVLFLSSIDASQDQRLVIPARLIRALKNLKEAPHLNDNYWQERIDHVLERIQKNQIDDLIPTILDLQLKIATRDDPVALQMDFFFLRFMYGKKMISDEELEYYEQLISDNVQKHKYSDFWNDLGVIHLIQCRHYFLNALEEIEKASKINPNFDEASENLEKIRRIKNGFLILLRALLRG